MALASNGKVGFDAAAAIAIGRPCMPWRGLQEMLDMLRDHQNNYHNVRLEWIVIWLIVVEVVVGLFELLGLFGLVGHEKS